MEAGDDVQASKRDAELQILLAIYGSVTTEMNRRHGERYRFHMLNLMIVGAVIAVICSKEAHALESQIHWVFALGPLAFAVVLGLMLKEHQYINMRDRYIEKVLFPRFEQLIPGNAEGFAWPGWEKFEHMQMGRDKALPNWRSRFWVFSFLDVLEYAIPTILSILSFFGYWSSALESRHQLKIESLPDLVSIVGGEVFIFYFYLMFRLRFIEQKWYPDPTRYIADR